jgi:biopolymer transport protein ExbB/TolQ
MDIVQTFSELASLGAAWVLWLLVILSILSVAVMIERALYFKNTQIDFDEFSSKLKVLLAAKDYAGIRELGANQQAVECKAVVKAAEYADKGVEAIQEGIGSFFITEKQKMDRWLIVLGTLGNNAPFIGLFGTVIGIIVAFQELAANTTAGASVVMGGISEALVATAVGLIVAIPAVISFNVFKRIVNFRISSAEAAVKLITAEISAS